MVQIREMNEDFFFRDWELSWTGLGYFGGRSLWLFINREHCYHKAYIQQFLATDLSVDWSDNDHLFRSDDRLAAYLSTMPVTIPACSALIGESGRLNSKAARLHIRGGADKSLAQPGRKQATATKLGIYSTYSKRSSIHLLAHCSWLQQATQKNSEVCPSNQVSAASMTSASDEKWRPFNCFFSPWNRW